MKEMNVLLNLIKILSDGDIHYENHLSKLLRIDKITIQKYMHTIRNWGVNVLTVP